MIDLEEVKNIFRWRRCYIKEMENKEVFCGIKRKDPCVGW